ncbi:MAG: response regulator [Actinomycetota bacterium]
MAKILVVDDDETIRQLICITLESLGHELNEAANGAEAITRVVELSPALVILDVMMPEMDGWAVMRELRKRGLKTRTRVLMLTASGRETDFVDGWKLGVDEYLTKPFDPDDLVKAVESTLSLTDADIRARKMRELEKANLLSRVESAFGEGWAGEE